MRVVVWNVANNPAAFAALASLKPDISLLNEASPPAAATGIWREETVGRDAKRRRWSAAVLSPHPVAEITDARPSWRGRERNVPFVCSRPGSWIAASAEVAGVKVTAVSLYGLLDEFSDASVHRSLSEISPLVDDPRYRRHLLIGGDLNTWTGWAISEAPFLARDLNLLQRVEAFGLVDCLAATRPLGRLPDCTCTLGDDCTHTRTRRDPRFPDIPYQIDYLWASVELASHLRSCEALATDEWFAISDHAPIVADFDLP